MRIVLDREVGRIRVLEEGHRVCKRHLQEPLHLGVALVLAAGAHQDDAAQEGYRRGVGRVARLRFMRGVPGSESAAAASCDV